MDIYEIVPYEEIEGIECETVEEGNFDEINAIGQKLSLTCAQLRGEGLAAPQVGIKKRMFVWRINNTTFQLILNPHYIPKSNSRTKLVEGCLSYPKRKFLLKRLKHITAFYQVYNKEKNMFEDDRRHLWGKEAVVFQHETDHCGNGKNSKSKTIRMIGDEVEF